MVFSHDLLVELYKKENQFQKIYTTFRPSLNLSPITGKFYAHHEENNNQSDPNNYYIDILKKAKSLGPKHKYSSAKTENQRYGWNDKLFIPRNEDIFLFPRVEAPEIKLDIILKKNYKTEKFTGIPFIL